MTPLGRKAECLRLDALLDGARDGRSGVLVLRGEAGIGKSTLLAYAATRAEGFRRLTVRGIEPEADLPFAGLGDLLRPILDRAPAIPEPQASALAGALALGPPARGDRLATCAATLSLLAAAAEESPLLVIADDAQWIDPSSTEALLFAARRIEAEGIVVLIGVRDDAVHEFERAGLPQLDVGGLERTVAQKLLTVTLGRPVAREAAERLFTATQGNPLALIEMPALLDPDQLDGVAPIDPGALAAPSLEQALLQPVARLPDETQRALVVAAASGSGSTNSVTPALAELGLQPQALDPAERAGVISICDGQLRFRHPLLRSAVYKSAPAGIRREAHEALARAASGETQLGARAWHLAATAESNQEDVAAVLEEAALSARRRGGLAESASAFERAADLTGGLPERARRLREAANDARLAGRVRKALELLERALADASTPGEQARIQHLRGVIEMWHGQPGAAAKLMRAEATAIEMDDPERAARMLTDAAWAFFVAGEIAEGAGSAEEAHAIGERVGGVAATRAGGGLGIALLLTGDSRKAEPLLAEYQRSLALEDPVGESAYQLLRPAGQVLTWFEAYEPAREMLASTIDSARKRSALGTLPYALASLSELDFRTGNWAAAYANASEAVRIADEIDQQTTRSFSLACLALIEGAQGRENDCATHANDALRLAYPHIGSVVAYANAALGLLELSCGKPDLAVQHLEQLRRRVNEHGLKDPAVIPWRADLIEAYVRVGRRDDAVRELAAFQEDAEATARRWALAAAARCRGLLAGSDAFEAAFGQAVELHQLTTTPFELARTTLCLGERLRRERRRSDAREPLRSALATFERLGAKPWADRARNELDATGETVRRSDPNAADQLTAQELQVALLVAKGATNREAGAALFLSPKTIETHLGRVYRKLNLRSRTELASRLAGDQVLARTPSV
jgi:DNA-binding CsgD family transcriptional regulator